MTGAGLEADRALSTRLFGYAILYGARQVGGEGALATFAPVVADPAAQARILARELSHHLGIRSAEADAGADAGEETEAVPEAAISVPFGRCGIDGLPLEHVRLYQFVDAAADVLRPGGVESRPLREGETLLVEPGSVVRFRARPRPGRRVLVAFQTEDRTPLFGNASPLTPEGEDPSMEAAQRLRQTTGAFCQLWQQIDAGSQQGRERLERFFAQMATRLVDPREVAAARAAARAAGSYDAGPSPALFDRARQLVTTAVLGRIAAGETALFRYPGMFGAVAPLFSLLQPG